MLKETWSTFDRFQKIVLCALAAMILLFGVLQTASTFRRGVVFGNNDLLTVTETGDAAVYTGKSYGEPVEITVRKVSDTLTEVTFVIGDLIHDVCIRETGLPPFASEHGDWITNTFRVEKNGVVLFDGGYADNKDFGRYHRDGSWEAPFSVSAGITGQSYWETNEISLGNINYFANGPEQVYQGSWGLYVLLVLLTLLLAVDVAHPLFLFRLEHCLDVRDPEPTDFYLTTQRIGWAILPVLLLFGYIWALRQVP